MDEVRDYLASIGRKGGEARARNLSPAKRSAGARKAARARWKGRKPRK